MKTSRSLSLALVAAATAALIGCAAPQSSTSTASAEKWTCAAKGLVSASYRGGSTAYVHLAGYTSGGTYPVTKAADGKTASGKTADGTSFTCKTA